VVWVINLVILAEKPKMKNPARALRCEPLISRSRWRELVLVPLEAAFERNCAVRRVLCIGMSLT
jgi:hypothetical protein